MTVLKLDSGGLFAYAPVAPTPECLRLLSELEAVHGPVRHILLPTLAVEHKAFAGAFSRKRPDAQFWAASAQFSFPIDLPLVAQVGLLPIPTAEEEHPLSGFHWLLDSRTDPHCAEFCRIVIISLFFIPPPPPVWGTSSQLAMEFRAHS